jgi:hypothetical protein
MKLYLKYMNGALYPDNEESANYLFQVKQGNVLSCDVKKPRNYEFLKKYMAMLNHGFEHWEPETEYKGIVIEKNFDKFREDVQIMAGYNDPYFNIKGELRLKSRSISFGNMSEEDFEKLYSAVINVLLNMVFQNYKREDLDDVVNELLRFG